MKVFSENKLIIAALVLLTGAASANKMDSFNSTSAQAIQNVSYTAHGKTDRKTALLFQQLLKNNPNLQVHAEVSRRAPQQAKRPVDVTVNYTVHGKTSMKKVRQMIELFKNNKEVEVLAQANIKTNSSQLNQNTIVNQRRNQNYNSFPAPYQPFYYNGYPPIFIQGNTIWYPVPVSQAMPDTQVQNIQFAKPVMIAGQ